MPRDTSRDGTEGDEIKAKNRPRTSTACNLCRKKRGKCDGKKPVCTPCQKSGNVCEFDLGSDKRKPFTKAIVNAMQLRIDTLESQLEALTMNGGNAVASGSGLPPGTQLYGGPSVGPKHLPQDVFQGGLALNAHGELRFYGPTSSYRAVLAETASSTFPSRAPSPTHFSSDSPHPRTSSTVEAIRAFSLTRAPIPTASPADPALPRRPPELSPDFAARLMTLAFEFAFSQFSIVPERPFYEDMQMYPYERTSNYSPFLFNVVLAIGARFLDPDEDYPPEICGLIGDHDTRGDVFVTWARYLFDQELYNPKLSTIRGLLCLTMYLAGRGFHGPCYMFLGLALRLVEDFGLHLGIHRLSMGFGGISDDLISARRDCFYSAFAMDVLISMYIGRNITFTPDEVDQIPPIVVPDLEFDQPMYRSSALHWGSKLMLVGGRLMSSIYVLKPGISLAVRQAAVPELHLALESWHHDLPSHLRASTADPAKAPHPHVIGLNLTFHMMHIQLHRPFFRRISRDPTTNLSTNQCIVSANHIVRLVKLQKNSAGLRMTPPGFQHSMFCAGTILAVSAVEDGISPTPALDALRRTQARNDLRTIVESLREAAITWPTASTSANILEALMLQWKPVVETKPDHQPFVQDATMETEWRPDTATTTFGWIFPSWDLDVDPNETFDFASLLNPLPESVGNSPEPFF